MGSTYPETLRRYFDEFRMKMNQRIRILGYLVKNYEDDIYFTIKVDQFIMKAVEPREEEVEPMGYEVVNDILIGYASTLLDSPLDPKKKRTSTYLERIKPTEVPKQKKRKVLPSVLAPVESIASPRVTKRSPAKKKQEAILPKVFERKIKTKNNTPDSEDIEPEVEMKNTRQPSKKTPIYMLKQLSRCRRYLKQIGRLSNGLTYLYLNWMKSSTVRVKE